MVSQLRIVAVAYDDQHDTNENHAPSADVICDCTRKGLRQPPPELPEGEG
jgi:hypothetical protein